MDFYIGQIFEDIYPSEAADWCNHNNAHLVEIDPVNKDVEEEYKALETKTRLVPAETYTAVGEDGTETICVAREAHEEEYQEVVTKTRLVNKNLRRFKIEENPEPSVDEKKLRVRDVRDAYLSRIEWRVSRYRDQAELGIETTDSEEVYHQILEYMQYLRDYPTSSKKWFESKPKTFEEWCEQ